MRKTTWLLLVSVVPIFVLVLAGWLWLSPSGEEIRSGTAEPPLATETREYMASHAVGSPINASERAKSMAWVSSAWMTGAEKNIKAVAEPVIYWVDYAFGRMIEKKFGVQKGLGRTLLMLATGIPLVVVLFYCGLWLMRSHVVLSGSGRGVSVFCLSITSGILIGMAELFQLGMEWYLLTSIAFLAGAALLFISAGLAVIDVFHAKFWTMLLLLGCVYGFALGIVIANVLTILAIFAVIAVFTAGISSSAFSAMSEQTSPSMNSGSISYDSSSSDVNNETASNPITVFKDEDGVEYRGVGEDPDEIVKQKPGDYTTYRKSPFDGKFRNNWNDEILEKKN